MSWESWFSTANTIALCGWLALIVLPRWPWLKLLLRYVAPGLLAIGYTVLAAVYFFQATGGGFGTLAQVKALLATEPTLLAGWIHYLAFDLFVGVWIAERADQLRISRVLQVPILAFTFLLGPVGYLMFLGAQATTQVFPSTAGQSVTS